MLLKLNFKLRKITFFIVGILVIFSCTEKPNIVETAPEPPRGDEMISDDKSYEEKALNHETIQKINTELLLQEVNVNFCIVDSKLEIIIHYELPRNFSGYGVSYSAEVRLDYHIDKNSFDAFIMNYREPIEFTRDAIINNLLQKVETFENNSKVKEIIHRLSPGDLLNRVNQLGEIREFNNIQFDFRLNEIVNYEISNVTFWENFPEVDRAHKIITEKLLVDKFSFCKINREEIFAKTYVSNWNLYSNNNAYDIWDIRIDLNCGEAWHSSSANIIFYMFGTYKITSMSLSDGGVGNLIYIENPDPSIGIPNESPIISYPSYP